MTAIPLQRYGCGPSNLFIRRDALAVWRWDPNSKPNVTDYNNATDADLVIAWALSNAATRWNIAEYADTARHIADALATEVVAPSRFGSILLPASRGFGPMDQSDGPVINLSYWIFPALEHLRAMSSKADWDAMSRTGRNLIRSSRFGPRWIPTNWIGLAGNEPVLSGGLWIRRHSDSAIPCLGEFVCPCSDHFHRCSWRLLM
jgi:endoglucanase